MPTPFAWPLGSSVIPPVDRGCSGKTSIAVPRPVAPGDRPFTGPAAMLYDGRTRDWLLRADGRYRSLHPVDQGMALSVLVRQGTLKSSPTTGSTLHEIKYLGGQDLQSDVEDRVKRSQPCARYLAAGKVRINRIEIDTSGNRLKVAVYYVNLAIRSGEEQLAKYYS